MNKRSGVKCTAKTNAGKRCDAWATEGGLCYLHANPNKAAELGRKGGRKNAHRQLEPVDPFPALNTAIEVRDTTARVLTDLHAGKIDPRTATSMGSLLSLQLRAVEAVDAAGWQIQVAELQKRLEHMRAWLEQNGLIPSSGT